MTSPELPVAVPWWRLLVASQRREMQRVVTQVVALRGFMPLLMKSRNGQAWSDSDKMLLIAHLRRLSHLSPYLLFLLLPGSAVLLPAYAWWLDRRRRPRR
ncbi:MAG: hypothetical protein KA603_09190 [Azonexus sp.]|jgi:hypothetical protein|nr:hypothetical protein [Betaproteobacteria bacterium]MBK8919524.1 hypothetical protein [Betaproteobacteria bacterium]MBP6036292.1 hypothetical protein [Azonexus sp.]MBP6906844.1 hypothetical protein [Azonexus sp.]